MTAHATLYIGQSVGGPSNPLKIGSVSQLRELVLNVGVMNQLGCSRADKHQVTQQGIKRAEKMFRFHASFSARAVGFCNLKELRMFASTQSRVEDGQCVGAGGYVGIKVETSRPAQGALTKSRHQSPLGWLPFRALFSQVAVNLFNWQGRESKYHRSRSDCRK